MKIEPCPRACGAFEPSHVIQWSWSLYGLGEFLISSPQRYIDKLTLIIQQSSMRRNILVPIKVSVFVSRFHLNKVLKKENLDKKGIELLKWIISCVLFELHV